MVIYGAIGGVVAVLLVGAGVFIRRGFAASKSEYQRRAEERSRALVRLAGVVEQSNALRLDPIEAAALAERLNRPDARAGLRLDNAASVIGVSHGPQD